MNNSLHLLQQSVLNNYKNGTGIFCEELKERKYTCPSYFQIQDTKNNEIVSEVYFQEGSIKDGLNGVTDEDILVMVLTRLQHLQENNPSSDIDTTIGHLKAALRYLKKIK